MHHPEPHDDVSQRLALLSIEAEEPECPPARRWRRSRHFSPSSLDNTSPVCREVATAVHTRTISIRPPCRRSGS
jgi:hypothetical protein